MNQQSLMLRETYSKMRDDQLLQLAECELEQLTPEAQQALQAELNARKSGCAQRARAGSSPSAASGTEEQLQTLVGQARTMACPSCKRREEPLNAFKLERVTSILVRVIHTRAIMVGCPTCIEARAKSWNFTTYMLGWWHFPLGIAATIAALATNSPALGARKRKAPTSEFLLYVQIHQQAIASALAEAEPVAPSFSPERADQPPTAPEAFRTHGVRIE
ncbi:MAG: hypothetical protein HY901_28335 [Deltaproteobacteria bacterium]|nr:hypothetical protein [Deltaproteobacteria bacterium]